ncbi:lipase family protein [Deinococcus pimensis]|uniref:lipase family protein n=1 Tax=Deinococcus pimensis TaxID=309888 RepID=UPI0004887305|nr:lipase family protein [Deinococcus pimensis]
MPDLTRRLALPVLMTLGSVLAQSAPNTLVSSSPAGVYTPAAVSSAGRALYARVNEPAPRYTVRRYEMRVRSTDEQGRPITVRAQIFVPDVPKATKLPVYVLGAGTTGLADNCSPFDERPEQQSWGWYQGHMLSYAAQGFIGVMPDYANFEDGTKLQPYFVSASEAPILLDAARAAYRFFQGTGKSLKAQPAQAVFFSGYSQGGHSSFAAADLASKYAPELPVRGVVAFGATTNVEVLWKENAAFAPYAVAAYADYYGTKRVDPAKILLPRVASGLDRNARSRCIGDLYEMYGKRPRDVFRPEFLQALVGNTLSQKYPEVAKVLAANSSGLSPSAAKIPAFVAQGTADDIVTATAQRVFVQKLCGLKRPVTYREYIGINHYQTRQVAMNDAMTWMRGVAAGQPVLSTCR